MTVDKAIAVDLSIGIVSSCSDMVFSGRLLNDEIKGYPEAGQCLDCMTWETDEWALSIGIEDGEARERRLPTNLMTKELQLYTHGCEFRCAALVCEPERCVDGD